MTSSVLERDVAAVSVQVIGERLVVELNDGRSIAAPLVWFPRLVHASTSERDHWQLWGSGYAIEWPDVDEHISVAGLLAGRKSGESATSLGRWLATRQSRP
ncbi:MAG: DUF2442 domain-containing protein [Pirellulaceae bacterium]|nr:DUF2442 domain-containing protein [Pirellulaceae bacterium]